MLTFTFSTYQIQSVDVAPEKNNSKSLVRQVVLECLISKYCCALRENQNLDVRNITSSIVTINIRNTKTKNEKLFRRGPWALLGRRPALFYAPWRLPKRQNVKNGIVKTSAGL